MPGFFAGDGRRWAKPEAPMVGWLRSFEFRERTGALGPCERGARTLRVREVLCDLELRWLEQSRFGLRGLVICVP
jgi:hypothetical protein